MLQLLHPVGNNSNCILYTRWGRVGENGQSQKKVRTQRVDSRSSANGVITKGPWPPSMAVNEFKKQFKAKAGVDWEQRVGMAPKKGTHLPAGIFL